MPKRMASVLLVALLAAGALPLVLLVHPARADTITVPDDYATIQEAINHANEGDTVFIKNGTYAQSRIIVNKTVTLLGESPEGAIIDGERSDDATVILNVITNNVKIMNLTVQNTTSGSGYIGVHLAIVQSVEVSGCIIRSSGTGIRLYNSSSCRIERNKIVQNSWIGIELQTNGTNNLIRDNLVANNQIGVHAEEHSGSNVVYHNNFVDNSLQTAGLGVGSSKWDNGYPSGGNYWSDYVGIDADGDGIGDAPYIIGGNNLDNYPLMNPWSSEKPRGSSDVNGDGAVDILDVVLAAASYGSVKGDPNWNPDADIASPYGRIDIFDLVTCVSHYGEKYP